VIQQISPQDMRPFRDITPTEQKPDISPQEKFGIDCVQQILHLLWIGQGMCKETTGVAERLCQEITTVTKGGAELLLQCQGPEQKFTPSMSNIITSFSVQFRDVQYGVLNIAPDSEHPTVPALPFSAAHLLAQVCSWLLYTFELSIFLQGQCQRFDHQMYGPLTKREREILMLMCLGNDQKSIAEKLCISATTVGKHRQHIYEQLGVHNERDAVLAAYQFGLFSILSHFQDLA